MTNLQRIEEVMRDIPKLHKAPRYIPLDKLPEGTLLEVTGVEGSYEIIVGIWPTILIVNYPIWGRTTVPVKPITPNIAPTANIEANYFDGSGNHVLTTEPLRCILVVGTPFLLQEQDRKDADRTREIRAVKYAGYKYSRGFRPLIKRDTRRRTDST